MFVERVENDFTKTSSQIADVMGKLPRIEGMQEYSMKEQLEVEKKLGALRDEMAGL